MSGRVTSLRVCCQVSTRVQLVNKHFNKLLIGYVTTADKTQEFQVQVTALSLLLQDKALFMRLLGKRLCSLHVS